MAETYRLRVISKPLCLSLTILATFGISFHEIHEFFALLFQKPEEVFPKWSQAKIRGLKLMSNVKSKLKAGRRTMS